MRRSLLPTLEEYLSNADYRFGPSTYINFPGLNTCYRHGPRNIDGIKYERVIQRINTSNPHRSQNIEFNPNIKSTGLYRQLDDLTVELGRKYGYNGIYVESVMNGFLGPKLLDMGYRKVLMELGTDNYFKEL